MFDANASTLRGFCTPDTVLYEAALCYLSRLTQTPSLTAMLVQWTLLSSTKLHFLLNVILFREQ